MLFHGGYSEIASPELRSSRFAKDFGKGFYCTNIREQAEKWARRHDSPVVNAYRHLLNVDLDVLKFSHTSEEWLDFVVLCRNGSPEIVTHNHDLIIGPAVEHQVQPHVLDFLENRISKEDFWTRVRFSYPTYQICFATEKSLTALKFERSWMLPKAGGQL